MLYHERNHDSLDLVMNEDNYNIIDPNQINFDQNISFGETIPNELLEDTANYSPSYDAKSGAARPSTVGQSTTMLRPRGKSSGTR
jgi:hypothetical protein